MAKRQHILLAKAAALLWAIGVIWIGSTQVDIPVFSRVLVTPMFFLAPGLVILVMILWIATCRFRMGLDDVEPLPTGCAADTDQRILQNTIEQGALALALWIPISFLLPETGLGVVICLSISFAIARVLYWIGAHRSPVLCAFGFAATIYPTLVAMIWAGIWWATF